MKKLILTISALLMLTGVSMSQNIIDSTLTAKQPVEDINIIYPEVGDIWASNEAGSLYLILPYYENKVAYQELYREEGLYFTRTPIHFMKKNYFVKLFYKL